MSLSLLFSLGLLCVQGGDSSYPELETNRPSASELAEDSTDAVFIQRRGDCADYFNTDNTAALGIEYGLVTTAAVEISAVNGECTFVANSMPNQDFNKETAAFAAGAGYASFNSIEAVAPASRR